MRPTPIYYWNKKQNKKKLPLPPNALKLERRAWRCRAAGFTIICWFRYSIYSLIQSTEGWQISTFGLFCPFFLYDIWAETISWKLIENSSFFKQTCHKCTVSISSTVIFPVFLRSYRMVNWISFRFKLLVGQNECFWRPFSHYFMIKH